MTGMQIFMFCWALVAFMAYALVRGATRIPSSREVRRAEALESN